jgi:hypothetical protein
VATKHLLDRLLAEAAKGFACPGGPRYPWDLLWLFFFIPVQYPVDNFVLHRDSGFWVAFERIAAFSRVVHRPS